MNAKLLDPIDDATAIAERQARGLDKYDEVWDGVYVMSPLADDEHQRIAGFFQIVLGSLIQLTGRGEVRPGINLTDRPADWTKSYRVPDVAVFLPSGLGVCHGTFWSGGPDFAVEIVSEGEDPYAKLDFYGRLGTRELLLFHRDPWRLELYGCDHAAMRSLQSADLNQPGVLSAAVGLTFSLRGDEENAELVITHPDGRSWKL